MKYLDCYAYLKNDVLTLGNSCIGRRFIWNKGQLIGREIRDKQIQKKWKLCSSEPDFCLPEETSKVCEGKLQVKKVQNNSLATEHLEASVYFRLGSLRLWRRFRIYPRTPAIACDYFVRGHTNAIWRKKQSDVSAATTVEKFGQLMDDKSPSGPVIERVAACINHLQLTSVEFFDVTDRYNNLVKKNVVLAYRGFPLRLPGNLLFAEDVLSQTGLFLLKEAPCSKVQLAPADADFLCCGDDLRVQGWGTAPQDISEEYWTRCYGVVAGVFSEGEFGALKALRTYQKQIGKPGGQDGMIMLNTWGDRSKYTRIDHDFALVELEAGHKLGVTHLQIDCGWQKGLYADLTKSKGCQEREKYWQVNMKRFPEGLSPVVKRAKELGIEVCLWFNPHTDNSFAHWKEDAAVLINLYKNYGIRVFKIDGVFIPDKRAEENLRALLCRVTEATEGNAFFNLDVTAGRRFGYHYFNEYGNVFVENRYTDWSNYYPHWTLRNLWQLSWFVPPEKLQMEFLNCWRNPDKYPKDDPLAPSRIPFEYCFAVTLMAQPLAWFEASSLPQEALSLSDTLRAYRQHMQKIHEGVILPLGEVPSGKSWTGFQSLHSNSGYVVVYREMNSKKCSQLKLWNLVERKIIFQHIIGQGKNFSCTSDKEGRVEFSLPRPFTYALYSYKLK